MALAKLSIDIVAELSKFESELRRANQLLSRFSGQVEKQWGGAAAAIRGAGAAIAVAGVAAGAFVAAVSKITSGLVAIKDLSEATGASIENISALENVLRNAGSTLETAAPVLVRFNTALREAGDNREIVSVIDQLGLSVKRLQELDPVLALREVAVALSKFEDDGNKARATMLLFGRSIREAGPLLRELVEQQEFAASVTTEQVMEADRLNKEMAKLKKNFEDVARSILLELAPALNQLFVAFQALKSIVFPTDLDKKKREVEDYTSRIVLLGKRLDRVLELERAGVPGMSGRVAQLRQELEQLMREGARASEELRRMIPDVPKQDEPQGPKPRLKLPGGGKKDRASEIDAARQSLASYIEQLQRELETVSELTEKQQALNFLRQLGSLGEVPQVRELVLQQAEMLDLVRAEKKERESLAAALEKIDRDRQRRENDLAAALEDVRKANGLITDELRKRWELYEELLNRGLITEEQFGMAVLATLDKITDAGSELKSITEDLGMTFASAFEDAVVSGRKLSDVLRSLASDITRLITRKLVTEPLAGFITGALGGLFGGGRALGGPVTAGRAYVVGESGPELFLPRVSGRVEPNTKIARSIDNITINISVPPGSSPNEFRSSARQLAVDVSRRISKVRSVA